LGLLADMALARVELEGVTLDAAVNACEQAGQLIEGLNFLKTWHLPI